MSEPDNIYPLPYDRAKTVLDRIFRDSAPIPGDTDFLAHAMSELIEELASDLHRTKGQVHRLKGDLELVVVDLDHILSAPEHVMDAESNYLVQRALDRARHALQSTGEEHHA